MLILDSGYTFLGNPVYHAWSKAFSNKLHFYRSYHSAHVALHCVTPVSSLRMLEQFLIIYVDFNKQMEVKTHVRQWRSLPFFGIMTKAALRIMRLRNLRQWQLSRHSVARPISVGDERQVFLRYAFLKIASRLWWQTFSHRRNLTDGH